jgi:hypothetical protein
VFFLTLVLMLVLFSRSTAHAIDFVTDTDSVTVPEGSTNTFSVWLSERPQVTPVSASVTRAKGDNDITVLPPTILIFDQFNWNSPQTVTLAAAQDEDEKNGTATIRVNASGIRRKDVTATESDDDLIVNFVTDTESVTVPEGDTASFGVRLSAQPESDVTASVSRESGDPDISVASGSSLTFTPNTWNTFQPVTLAADEDPDAENGSATIRVRDTAGRISDKDLQADEEDDDSLTFVTDTSEVTIPEGGTATFQVKLGSMPQDPVTATVSRQAGDEDISVVSGSILLFNPPEWNVFQTVTLSAGEDDDGANGTATIRIAASGLPDKDISARELDNETITVLSPNGGETIIAGTTHEITWTGAGSTGASVAIELIKGGAFDSTIIPSTPNDGSFSWTIPVDQPGGSDYRVRVTSESDPSISDESDADFSIVGTSQDTDTDGVPDVQEMGPAGDDPEYDGNGNGIPDNQENTTASLPTHDDTHYVTLEGSGELSGVAAVTPPPGAPEDTAFPYGFFAFTVATSSPGGPASVILFTDGVFADTYHKFGATPGDLTPHWYPFTFDPETVTGAEFDGFLIMLHFVDGLTGDDDLVTNAIVVDQGGPGVTGAAAAEEVGKDCFIATAAYGSPLNPHVRLLRTFRDRFLLSNRAGTWFVKNYYRYSPPLAAWLAKHDTAKAGVRFLLTPLVVLAWLLQNAGLTMTLLGAAGLFVLILSPWKMQGRKGGREFKE